LLALILYIIPPNLIIFVPLYYLYREKLKEFKGLFGEKIGMEWNQDLNPGGLGMELES